jgi:nitrate reductase delta subunit
MAAVPGAYDLLAAVLTYPDEGYLGAVADAQDLLEPRYTDAAQQIAEFAGRVSDLDTDELRELFTVTFDLNPVCSLDVGWHLHGDAYERGEFLVKARGFLRACGIVESAELPDHLANLLRALPRLGPEDARDLATAAVLPALGRMVAALNARSNPYEHALNAVYCLVTADFGPARPDAAPAPAFRRAGRTP